MKINMGLRSGCLTLRFAPASLRYTKATGAHPTFIKVMQDFFKSNRKDIEHSTNMEHSDNAYKRPRVYRNQRKDVKRLAF